MFLWGAATSSHQIEGYNKNNDWWEWENQGKIEGGVRSGIATDHWNRFKEDLRLAADLGLNSYRFSIEWSRIEPNEGVWNNEALDWYRNLIDECEKQGLVPMITLHHFTSPLWFAKQGGFTWREAPSKFAAYVGKVYDAIGARVPLWCIFNEPSVLVIGTYLGKFMPPAIFDPRKVPLACSGLLKSHVLAYDLLHSKHSKREGPWKDMPLQVGVAHNLVDFLPDRTWHPMELLLSFVFHRFYNKSWLDALTGKKQSFGFPGVIPRSPVVSEALGRATIDFIGVNYYTKGYVQWKPRDTSSLVSQDLPLGLAFSRRGEVASDLGWAIHPKGLGRMLRFVSKYKKPIYVTENGIADSEDKKRPDYLQSHLSEIDKAMKKGLDIRGYYHWSLLDNFEWIKGFWPRFGLYRVDYQSLERHPTPSCEIYREWIKAHTGF